MARERTDAEEDALWDAWSERELKPLMCRCNSASEEPCPACQAAMDRDEDEEE